MKIYLYLIIKVILLITFPSTVLSQVSQTELKRQLNELNKGSILASVPTVRVGKGAVFWMIKSSSDMLFASNIYMSCDGKFISDALDFEISLVNDGEKRLIEFYNNIKLIDPTKRTSTVKIHDFDESTFREKHFIRQNIQNICNNLQKEKRGELIPIADSAWKSNNTSQIISFLPGTMSRNGDIVDGWLRSYEIIRTVQLKADGSITKFEDTPLYKYSLLNKKYSMIRSFYNCRTLKHSLRQIVKYDDEGTMVDNFTYEAKYDEVIPGSITEVVIENLCKIY